MVAQQCLIISGKQWIHILALWCVSVLSFSIWIRLYMPQCNYCAASKLHLLKFGCYNLLCTIASLEHCALLCAEMRGKLP